MIKTLRQYIEQLKYTGINEIYKTKTQQLKIPKTSDSPKLKCLLQKQQEYSLCQKCSLWTGRNRFVYGEGNSDTVCMVIGEGPGEQENLQGRPFVGPAGHLLDKMLAAINIKRNDVYIANIVKCRPPGNRNPEQAERIACLPYLIEQIEIIQPQIFLFMGLVAAQTLLATNQTMQLLRATPHVFMDRQAFVTYHPSALLRNPNWKKPAWEDLQKFQVEYEALLR
ncbi:MAG: uracil-DNA glycosylase [Candidatus Cloacimonetes bacterium]|nr:uracil-DNA glycosylase [Candidatus Cloacimonadota bacterium]